MANRGLFKNYKPAVISGAVLIAAGVVMNLLNEGSSILAAGSGMLVGLGSVFLVFGIILMLRKEETVVDERSILHRLKATRFSAILGILVICGFLVFSTLSDPENIRWDYFIFLGVILIGKLSARLYYRLTN